jgi:hypothetical protein
MGDIAPFMSPDGVMIEGRAQWREHLKRTDSIEMGHSDVKYAQQEWNKKKAAHNDRLRGQVFRHICFQPAQYERQHLLIQMYVCIYENI